METNRLGIGGIICGFNIFYTDLFNRKYIRRSETGVRKYKTAAFFIPVQDGSCGGFAFSKEWRQAAFLQFSDSKIPS